MTVDELLSSDEVLTVAAEEGKRTERHFCDLSFGLLDICMILLLFLPLFGGEVAEGTVQPSSLIALGGVQTYLRVLYFATVIGTAVWGVLTLALQNCGAGFWVKAKTAVSLALGVLSVLLFTVSRQPYAAVFALALLVIKVLMQLRRA